MMDIDKLKKDWQQSTDDLRYSRAALNSIFEVKTKRSLRQINRSMWLDAVIMLLVTASFIVISFMLGLKDRYVISGELLLVALLLYIHYKIKRMMLNQVQFTDSNIKNVLERIISKMQVYLYAYSIIIPATGAGLYLLYQYNLSTYSRMPFTLATTDILITSCVGATLFLITRFICRLMYGHELDKLISFRNDLKDGA